jgi:hypothetical protein
MQHSLKLAAETNALQKLRWRMDEEKIVRQQARLRAKDTEIAELKAALRSHTVQLLATHREQCSGLVTIGRFNGKSCQEGWDAVRGEDGEKEADSWCLRQRHSCAPSVSFLDDLRRVGVDLPDSAMKRLDALIMKRIDAREVINGTRVHLR